MAEDDEIGAPDQNELVIALVAAVGTDVGMVAEELAIELSEYAYDSETLRLSNYLAEEFDEDFFKVKEFDEALWDAMSSGDTLGRHAPQQVGSRRRPRAPRNQRHRRYA